MVKDSDPNSGKTRKRVTMKKDKARKSRKTRKRVRMKKDNAQNPEVYCHIVRNNCNKVV